MISWILFNLLINRILYSESSQAIVAAVQQGGSRWNFSKIIEDTRFIMGARKRALYLLSSRSEDVHWTMFSVSYVASMPLSASKHWLDSKLELPTGWWNTLQIGVFASPLHEQGPCRSLRPHIRLSSQLTEKFSAVWTDKVAHFSRMISRYLTSRTRL